MINKRMLTDPDYIDDDIIFGSYKGQPLGLSLDNKYCGRSANVLVIGGTGTGKTFKFVKPNILQENASMVITDPSGDIFASFSPYLLSRGYNVYLFNANDFTLSNHYNPLLNVYDSNGEIVEQQVDVLVNLYMKNAKAGKEAGAGDPFWDKSEQAFMTALIYYVLENDDIPKYDKCFNKILSLVQMAKVDDDSDEESELTKEMNAFFATHPKCKCKRYYGTFQIAPMKTANTILITTAVDLQIFATEAVDKVTRVDERYPEMNIDIEKIATQQSYLFLGIPQAHQAYNFLIAMLYSQLFGKLYELGDKKFKGKTYHIGYEMGRPVFDYFESKEQAVKFYETVTEENIIEKDYVNNTKMYSIVMDGRCYKSSVLREPLVKMINDMEKMVIWKIDDYCGDDPSLPIHVNFVLDEFKNIGEIPNFLNMLATCRKYRIGLMPIIQSVSQIQTMYKDNEYKTLLGNVDTTIFLGSESQDDLKFAQELVGKTTIRQRSTSDGKSGGSTSWTPTEVPVMSLDEIEDLNNSLKQRDDAIVKVRNCPAFVVRKLLVVNHRRWKYVKAVKGIDTEMYYRNNKEDDKTAII
jgi:type IV secretory pathway TraG/TraD family ATPase VirD4